MSSFSNARTLSIYIAIAFLFFLLAPAFRRPGVGRAQADEEQFNNTKDFLIISVVLVGLMALIGSDLKYTAWGRLANFLFLGFGAFGVFIYHQIQRRDRELRRKRHRRPEESSSQQHYGPQQSQRSQTQYVPPPPPPKDTFDPYKVLGLSRGAKRVELSRRYRELANQFHPDKLPDSGPDLKRLASERMLEIQKAYEMLKKEIQH
jgi:hypothetical protein